ncbi:MAG: hypothetical protein DRO40_09745 [Thermoprotei archaeon]|nr:MAG: hypothetical protein DRO40_09745 [Thermoprotei archaeon]
MKTLSDLDKILHELITEYGREKVEKVALFVVSREYIELMNKATTDVPPIILEMPNLFWERFKLWYAIMMLLTKSKRNEKLSYVWDDELFEREIGMLRRLVEISS